MLKFAFFTGSSLSVPAIEYLRQAGLLACVVLPDADTNPDLFQLQQWLQQQQITMLRYHEQQDQPLLAQLDNIGVDRGIIYLFRHKVRPSLIQYFQSHLVNIHPSPLPEYRGPQPLYWQIRNGESSTKLTLHKVTEQLDAGDIGCEVSIAIHPFDTIRCVHYNVAQALPHLVSEYIEMSNTNQLIWRSQAQSSSQSAPQLTQSDVLINWLKHSATDISNMARAGNSDVASALFMFRQSTFQLLQASKVDCNLLGIKPGTITQLDKRVGLVVKTLDGAVSIDVVNTHQGTFDGYRFALLFCLEPGMELGSDAHIGSRQIG